MAVESPNKCQRIKVSSPRRKGGASCRKRFYGKSAARKERSKEPLGL